MFDASNRQACRVRNSETSTPLHALTTLNDPTWVEAARCLAASSLQHAKSLEPQLVYAFRKVLCRTPTTKDLQRLSRAHQKQLEIYQSDETAALALLSIGQAKRNTELQAPQHAAMTAVCLALLNLDEALTRE